jgi:hypothetical protein
MVCAKKITLRGTGMRITLIIDDDVLVAAKHLAERERKSVDEVISSLVRQELSHKQLPSRAMRNGIPLLARQAGVTPITLGLVNQLRDG